MSIHREDRCRVIDPEGLAVTRVPEIAREVADQRARHSAENNPHVSLGSDAVQTATGLSARRQTDAG